ncbi:MAG: glycosyltransferase family 4 protein, partial [Deltaproteobacteria bacterium]|nr:glycosyltransferase family 4 protein [Deltaproteobacteria bacterium]
ELKAKANYVYEVHQLELLDHADQEKIDLELRTLSKADVLFTTTYQLLKVLQEYLPGISIVPIGLACNSKNLKEEPVPETGGESAFTVLYIGSLYRQQGIEWLVKNWGHVKPSADSQLVLVGGNKDAAEKIKNMATQRGLDSIDVRGFIPPPELGQALSLADVLIIPSLPEGRMPYVAITNHRKWKERLAFQSGRRSRIEKTIKDFSK